ncbi:MAG: hypothetical protein VYB80_01455, partial [Actinomycetota bacterium]|nr:hypothetical protein [Actinomycetota bacterium]
RVKKKVRVHLVVDNDVAETRKPEAATPSSHSSDDEGIDIASLDDADETAGDGFSLVEDNFPGAKIVDDV